jgi:hypothetical protein
MKRTFLWLIVVLCLAFGPSCDNLVNGLDNFENMSAANTADGVNDIIGMDINSTDGALTITVDYTDPDSGDEGVLVDVSGTLGCLGLESGGFFPYGTLGWEAGFDIVFNDCAGDSGAVYNGTLHIGLSGLLGSVSNFDFTGRITASGAIDGRLDINAHFAVASCAMNWDCWSGSVNGYSFEKLHDAL